MIHGSCLCGKVTFQLAAQPQLINFCHCSMCRKATGSAFGSFLHADGETFKWLSGETAITQFQSSANNLRSFCSACGSIVPVLEADGAHVIIPAGSLDNDPGVRPIVHIFVGSKAPWFDISDSLPQFAEFPPNEFWEPDDK